MLFQGEKIIFERSGEGIIVRIRFLKVLFFKAQLFSAGEIIRHLDRLSFPGQVEFPVLFFACFLNQFVVNKAPGNNASYNRLAYISGRTAVVRYAQSLLTKNLYGISIRRLN